MRIWQWMAAALTIVFLAACQPVMPPAEGGTVPPAPEEPAAEEPAGLTGVTWEWQRTQAADGAEIVAQDPSRYTLTFREGGRVDVQFDCNGGGGDYFVEGDSLTFGALVSTLMGCPEGSQADAFSEGLNAVTSYALDGETLTLGLADDGEMVFRAAGAEAAATPAATEEAAEQGESPAEDMTAENPSESV